jgi:hypothetical protein
MKEVLESSRYEGNGRLPSYYRQSLGPRCSTLSFIYFLQEPFSIAGAGGLILYL